MGCGVALQARGVSPSGDNVAGNGHRWLAYGGRGSPQQCRAASALEIIPRLVPLERRRRVVPMTLSHLNGAPGFVNGGNAVPARRISTHGCALIGFAAGLVSG